MNLNGNHGLGEISRFSMPTLARDAAITTVIGCAAYAGIKVLPKIINETCTLAKTTWKWCQENRIKATILAASTTTAVAVATLAYTRPDITQNFIEMTRSSFASKNAVTKDQTAAPEVATAQVTASVVSEPKVSIPEVATAQVTASVVSEPSIPKVTTTQAAAPEVATAKATTPNKTDSLKKSLYDDYKKAKYYSVYQRNAQQYFQKDSKVSSQPTTLDAVTVISDTQPLYETFMSKLTTFRETLAPTLTTFRETLAPTLTTLRETLASTITSLGEHCHNLLMQEVVDDQGPSQS